MRARRLLSVLLLLGAAAAQEKHRAIAEILDDHARALGDITQVFTLRATLDTRDGKGYRIRGAESVWRLPGACVRTLPLPKGRAPLREYFVQEGAFVKRPGFVVRWRPGQPTTCGGYYFLKALAEPFPLQPYLANARRQQGLSGGVTQGRDVIVGPRDEHGVRAVFLLHGDSHMIDQIRYERDDNRPLAQVRYADYRDVGGVKLPHRIHATFHMQHEDPGERRLKLLAPEVRSETIRKWEINPAVAEATWTPPGRSARPAKGFQATTHATGPNPFEVAAGDFDGDGAADFAAACDGGVMVHFAGKKRPLWVPLASGQCRGLAADDFDIDGRAELLTTSNVHPARMFYILDFDAERTPEVRSAYGAPEFTHSIVTADFDRDGLADWACTGYEGAREMAVKYGTGSLGMRRTGTSWPLTPPDGKARRGFGLAVGNVDGNRLQDIAVADGRRIVVFLGQVNGGFQPYISFPKTESEKLPWRPVAVVLADLDANGRDDLLVASERPGHDLSADLFVIMNGKDRLVVKATHDSGHGVQSVATGYFNDDRHLDVVTSSLVTGEISILFGDGAGGLSKPVRMASGRGTCRVRVADMDGDGVDDVVASNRLDDTVTVFRNTGGRKTRRVPPVRARAAPPPTEEAFRLEGLTDPYEFAGEFRIPADIQDPSGIACLGADGAQVQFAFVSDKRSAIFRAVLDRARKRLLVGPAIPLQGVGPDRLDLEGVAFDRPSGSLFLACEADAHVLRVSLFGHVLGRAKTVFDPGGNDGLEAVAVHRLKDGSPELFVFKERVGKTLARPPLHRYGIEEKPFALVPKATDLALPVADQTGATVFGGKMFVVHRLARSVIEVDLAAAPFGEKPKTASYASLAAALGLRYRDSKRAMYGMVEGVTLDPQRADLFLLVDNNRQVVGKKDRNEGPEGRLLWFRNRGVATGRTMPSRVVFEHIRIAFADALDSEGVTRSRAAAAAVARDVLVRAKANEDFGALARAHHDEARPLPATMRVVVSSVLAEKGELALAELPAALGRLAFNLEVGEVGFCAYHDEESPYGFHVVRRVK